MGTASKINNQKEKERIEKHKKNIQENKTLKRANSTGINA